MRSSLLSMILVFLLGTAWAVEPGTFHAQGPRDKKAITLTFDDGPGPYTSQILDILKEFGVKATFFMSSDQVKNRPQLAKKVVQDGHEIGDHTWSHTNFYAYEKKNGKEKTGQAIRKELSKSKKVIEEILQTSIRLCRMPHGYHRAWLKGIAKDFGYTLVNWSFGEDWHKISQDKMAKDYLANVSPGAILLFHDGGRNRQKTVAIVPQVIQKAKKLGFEVVTVSELLD